MNLGECSSQTSGHLEASAALVANASGARCVDLSCSTTGGRDHKTGLSTTEWQQEISPHLSSHTSTFKEQPAESCSHRTPSHSQGSPKDWKALAAQSEGGRKQAQPNDEGLRLTSLSSLLVSDLYRTDRQVDHQLWSVAGRCYSFPQSPHSLVPKHCLMWQTRMSYHPLSSKRQKQGGWVCRLRRKGTQNAKHDTWTGLNWAVKKRTKKKKKNIEYL